MGMDRIHLLEYITTASQKRAILDISNLSPCPVLDLLLILKQLCFYLIFIMDYKKLSI